MRRIDRLMRKWIPALVAACLCALSFLVPISYQSDGAGRSVWTVYSGNGHLGWGWVELSGPDPEREFGTTAQAALEAYVDRSTCLIYRFQSNMEARARDPKAESDAIHRYQLGLGWPVLMLLCISPCLRSSRRSKQANVERDRPSEQSG